MNRAAPKSRGGTARASARPCCPRPAQRRAIETRPYARLFKALGHPTRLAIVGLLAGAGRELCACELESQFELGQPAVSHHLRILREGGWVTAERRGTWVYYALERAALERLSEFRALLEG